MSLCIRESAICRKCKCKCKTHENKLGKSQILIGNNDRALLHHSDVNYISLLEHDTVSV